MENNFADKARKEKDREYDIIKRGEKRVSDPKDWRPVKYEAFFPETGVKLRDGFVKELFDKNIENILKCYKMEDYCNGPGWAHWLPASNDGRMLAGAANSIMWCDEKDKEQLRKIVEDIISGIKKQVRDDGYFNYYPEEEAYICIDEPEEPNSIFRVHAKNSERKNYDRVFWTRGMISASRSGNKDALPILRAMYDWFNSAEKYLPYILRGANATNGFPGGPIMYHTELGKPEDILTNQRWYDQDYWMDQFIAGEKEAFSAYAGDRPHCYDLLELEALADEYRATGHRRYLDALLGAWEIYRSGYMHIGGATAICEAGGPYPYKSYYITTGHNGETCGSVFWIWVNSRLLQLAPSEEKYAFEIEQSLFNIIGSCRDLSGNTRYHNRMQGVKEKGTCHNTCCEVSSTMLISELPKYIYREDDLGVWVDLFVPSTIKTNKLCLEMTTDFPYDCNVSICVKEADEGRFHISIRIPSWAKGGTEFFVNGESVCVGAPGSYVRLEREWKCGDIVTFRHKMSFSVKNYEGRDTAPDGRGRVALMYGPILMALTGSFDEGDIPVLNGSAERLIDSLIPSPDVKLHFAVEGQPELLFKPYFEVDREVFNCFPSI